MKALRYLIPLLVLPLFLTQCEPKVDPVGPDEPKEQESETHTLTFVLPTYGEGASTDLKTSWQAGDVIVVHGEYAAQQVSVTLSASDISADGKSATKTVEGLYPYKRDDCTSTMYASYPGDKVDNLKHCFFYSKFSTTATQLLAACNDGDTFRFQDVCGVLTFEPGDEYESYTIVGTKKEPLGYEFLQVKITDNEQNFTQYTGSPLINLEGDIEGGVARIFIPDGLSMAGAVIKLRKNGQFVSIYRHTSPIEIKRGEEFSLGDISEGIEPYDDPFSADILDLDADGNANCYVVTAPGTYKFKAVYGNNSVSFIEGVEDAGVVWETWNNGEEVTAGSIIKSVSYAEDYMIFHTADEFRPGNALIAAKDGDGKILWSWHIWVPETAIGTVSGIFSTDCMDRNLGALVVAEAGSAPVVPEAFGMMYQWGRKDPYPASKAISSSSPATLAGTQVEKAPARISLAESIANPTLMGHTDNGDWVDPSDAALWSDDAKTIYDPCPPGYRVPTSSSNNFWGDISTMAGWSFDKTNGWLTTGSPASVFPLCGYRDDYSVESIAHAYDRGLYWSSATGSETKPGVARGEDIRPGSSISFKETPKSRSGCVRCVKE